MLTPLRPIRSLIIACLVMALGPRIADASMDAPPASGPAALCEAAGRRAAAETGVPPDILAAVALTETGRRQDGTVRPWAWSVNSEGQGTWFDDPAQALAHARDRLAQGRTNLDIGCFQINYHWHGDAFASVVEMFDPLANARYAARFLRDLHAETGDWRLAAGAFHSRNSKQSSAYLARFDELHAMLHERRGGRDAPETYNRFMTVAGRGTSAGRAGDGLGTEVPVPALSARGPIDVALSSGKVAGMTEDADAWMLDMTAPYGNGLDLTGGAPDRRRIRTTRHRIPQESRTLLGALPGTEPASVTASLAILGNPALPLIGVEYPVPEGQEDPLARAILLAAAGSLTPEATMGPADRGSLWQ